MLSKKGADLFGAFSFPGGKDYGGERMLGLAMWKNDGCTGMATGA